MLKQPNRWLRSRRGKRALVGIVGLALALLVVGSLLGWWPAALDYLMGFAGPEGVQPTEVVLLYFTGSAGNQQITLAWETEVEVNNQGFNLYRAEPAGAPFVRINPDLIPSQAQGGAGATYQVGDTVASAGVTLQYFLESVDQQSLPTYQETITVEIPASPPSHAGFSHQVLLPLVRR